MVANFQRFCGLQADGKVTNKFLNVYFRVASTAGEEIFTLMPLVFWLAFPVAISFLTNFLILQIAGQLTKDFFRLPRPISPPGCKNPIIKLDNHFDTEYGLPSTHTIAGLLPATTMLILLRHGVPISTPAWIAAVIYWISVALSRLYLGVHSVYDVIAGALLGTTLTAVLHAYGDALDVLFYQCADALWVQFALLGLYFAAYPRSGPWSASFGTAAQMMGPFFGCGVSLW
jgi:membrane-associated phospholipid phosphatase